MRWYDWALLIAVLAGMLLAGYVVGYAHGFFVGWMGV